MFPQFLVMSFSSTNATLRESKRTRTRNSCRPVVIYVLFCVSMETDAKASDVQFPLCEKESIEWNNLREIKNYLTIYLGSIWELYVHAHNIVNYRGVRVNERQVFLRYLSYLVKRVNVAATQSILASASRITYPYVVRTRWSIHYVPGPLFADQTSDHPRGQQEQHSIRIEVKWTNTPSRTNKLN